MTAPPVLFSDKIKSTASGGGYPVQISASDLDKNFVFGLLEAPALDDAGNPQPFLISEKTGAGGHQQRQLIFNPPPPQDGETYRLGFVAGAWAWAKPVLPDGTASGQLLQWDSAAQAYVLLTPSAPDQLLRWDAAAQAWALITPSSKALLYYDGAAWNFIPETEGSTYLKGNLSFSEICTDVKTCMQPDIDAIDARLDALESLGGGSYFPPQPTAGTHVLGAVNGTLTWLATEAC
jgi:hypothetical protein